MLPVAAAELGLTFVSLLAGLVLLLPGSLLALVARRFVWDTALAPSALDLLALGAAIAVNAGMHAGLRRTRSRPKLPSGFRALLWLALLGNATALAFMWLWSPGAGLSAIEYPHVQRVLVSIALTVLAIAIAGAGLLDRRRVRTASWGVVAVQCFRLVPASLAMRTWPGGDDGPGMAWAGLVIPFTWLLAVAGAVAVPWCAYVARRRESP